VNRLDFVSDLRIRLTKTRQTFKAVRCLFSSYVRLERAFQLFGLALIGSLSLVMLTFSAARDSRQLISLPPPWQQKTFVNAFNLESYSFPQAANGYLWSFRERLTDNERHAIRIISLQDERVTDIPFGPKDAGTLWVNDVTITADHEVLVGGSSSAGDGQLANFVVKLDFVGNVLGVFDIGSLEPGRVCSDTQGGFWTIGQDKNAETSNSNYDMLRKYSSAGVLLKSYLASDAVYSQLVPRSLENKNAYDLNLIRRFHDPERSPGNIFLVCGNSSVGAYISQTKTWVEVTDDRVLQTWTVALPAKSTGVTGVVLLNERRVYASMRIFSKDGKGDFMRGLYALQFSQDGTASWATVDGALMSRASIPEGFARLVGRDGPSLVYLRNGYATINGTMFCCSPGYYSGNPPLFWSRP
jgi:hypothetical protein